MKKLIISALVLAVAIAQAAQDTSLTMRDVRDPVKLKAILEANATDAESRLAALATSITTNENIVVPGTLGVTGVTTLTGNAIANELDARTATALLLGKATATSVTLGASDAGVTVPGTLAVTGVATLTAAPKLTATTAGGAIALVMTNAPAACDAGKAAPVFVTITIGTTNYVVPAWPLTP